MTHPHNATFTTNVRRASRREQPTPRADVAPVVPHRAADDTIWIKVYLLVAFSSQLLLLIPALSPLRVPLRIAPFATSLIMALFIRPHASVRLHPAVWALAVAMFVTAAGVMHPWTASIAGAAATIAQSLAIAAPLLWASGIRIDARGFRTVILFVWSFAALSAFVGVLQTIRPDWTMLQPNLSAVVQNFNDGGEGLKISLNNGAQVFRPMGLSDQPGGAASAGMTTIVFGLALFATHSSRRLRVVLVAGMILGLNCILLSQVRSLLVMTGVCAIAFMTVIAWRGEFARVTGALTALGVVALIGVVWSLAIAGESVTARLSTLVEDDPRMVYYSNRGYFLENTIRNTIPAYPFGAGLGRWGMINYYFGGTTDIDSLWAEIMWTAWVYDGGVPLLLSYATAIGIAVWQAWKIGAHRMRNDGTNDRSEIGLWGAMIFAFNIGALAITFNFPFFASQMGMDFWLLNGLLFVAAQTERGRLRTPPARGAFPVAPSRSTVPMPRGLTEMGA